MSRQRHSRAPLRRSSVPERILSAGLATATCVGVVGLLGARTIQANAVDDQSTEATTAVSSEPAAAPTTPLPPATTSSGLTQADLDAYAAALATEKARLDAYRAKLTKAARKLAREVQQYNAAQQSRASAPRPVTVTSVPSQPKAASRPQASTPKAQTQQAAPAPAPQAQPAPAPAAAPQPAPKPQSNTKGS